MEATVSEESCVKHEVCSSPTIYLYAVSVVPRRYIYMRFRSVELLEKSNFSLTKHIKRNSLRSDSSFDVFKEKSGFLSNSNTPAKAYKYIVGEFFSLRDLHMQ